MRHVMRNPHELKVRRYADLRIKINAYLNFFTVGKVGALFCETELDVIILNFLPNGRSDQAYMQYFDSEDITFKNLSIFLNAYK